MTSNPFTADMTAVEINQPYTEWLKPIDSIPKSKYYKANTDDDLNFEADEKKLEMQKNQVKNDKSYDIQLDEYRITQPSKMGELPKRFKDISKFQGYGKNVHPGFRTTNQTYGNHPPTKETTHEKHFGYSKRFTNRHTATGNYRYYGLNM